MPGSEGYVPYDEIAAHLGIRAGETMLVSSDVLRLVCACRDRGERFDANRFIDSLIAQLGDTGTLLFPTFTWDFCRGKPFDYRNTPSAMGALTNAALKRADFARTRHAIYSFAVHGPLQMFFTRLDNISSWSEDSPFGHLARLGARNLFVGIDYKNAFTFDHYVEEKVGVDYRYFKDFHGPYVDAQGQTRQATYRMYARDLSRNVVTAINPRMDAMPRGRRPVQQAAYQRHGLRPRRVARGLRPDGSGPARRAATDLRPAGGPRAPGRLTNGHDFEKTPQGMKVMPVSPHPHPRAAGEGSVVSRRRDFHVKSPP